jgi:serine protease
VRKIRLVAVIAAVLLLADMGWAPPAQAEPPAFLDLPTTLGEAVIGFQPGFLPAVGAGGVLSGLPVTRVSKGGNFLTVAVPNLGIVRNALANIPGVRYVEDNGVMKALVTPNDARYGEQYGPGMMHFPEAWGMVGYGTSNVTVALVDSGIRKTHQDFDPARILQGYDYVNNDNNPDDNCGHGTHTAGTVGATTNNSVGVAGMAQVKILEMKGLSSSFLSGCSGSNAGIAQAIRDAADQGAKVISMSIGGASSTVMQDAVSYAAGKGVIIVAAAGNDGGNNSIDYPGAYPEVIAVAALDSNKTRASYSDGGPQLDISAPGSNVLSTYNSNDTSYSSLSGTSMATPHVAGAIALALSCAQPGYGPTQIVQALYNTAEDLGAAGRDDLYGYGLARADRLVQQVCNGTPPANQAPTANFTVTQSASLTASVNGASSTDPDGDALTYAWNWGDGNTTAASPTATATHAYAAAGNYNITLTVNDGHAHTNAKTIGFAASVVTDPDPGTPTITSGQTVSVAVSSTAVDKYYKILVPAGKAQLKAVTTGPSCSFFSCSLDADLYTRSGAKPTTSTYTCRSNVRGNAETCTSASPVSGYWYVLVHRYSGSGTVNLTVTLS